MNKINMILKMNFQRFKRDKSNYFLLFIMIPLTVIFSVYFSTKINFKDTVAVIGVDKEAVSSMVDLDEVNLEEIDTKPKESEIMMGKYAGIISMQDGECKYTSYNSEDVLGEDENEKGSLESILGLIFFFIFIQSMQNTKFYMQDRASGNLKRIFASGVKNYQYMLSQILFNIIVLTIPLYVFIEIACLIFSVDISVGFVGIFGLVLVLSILSTSIAFLIAKIIDDEDSAIMTGNVLMIASTLLSGAFGNLKPSGLLRIISDILPQKIFLNLISAVESGVGSIINNVIILSVIIFAIVIFLCMRKPLPN